MSKFQVCEGKCNECLFTKDRIVSEERMRQILGDLARQDGHFICHKASMNGQDVCCRGFYDTRSTNFIRAMQRMNLVEFVDPATGKPSPPNVGQEQSRAPEDATDDLAATKARMEERMCRCGSPRGQAGIVEKVYRGRNSTALRCKVIMDSGAVRYFDVLDVYTH